MLQVKDIFLKYGDRVLLDHITFLINKDDKIALVGRNGVGKSTLFQIICKRSSPDGGEISSQKGIEIGYLEQTLTIDTNRTIREEVRTAYERIQELENEIQDIQDEIARRDDYQSQEYLQLLERLNHNLEHLHHLGAAQMEKEIERVVIGLGFKSDELDRRIDTLSGGWQMRVQLAQLLLRQPDLLLLDEPTNHLDIEAIIWLEEYIRSYPGAIILISHDKTFLRNTADRVIELENGMATDYAVGYDRYMDLKKERSEQLEAAYKNQQKTIAQKERTIKRFMAKASKTSMAQSMQKQLEKMDRIELTTSTELNFRIRFLPVRRSSRTIVKATSLAKSYGQNRVLQGIDLDVERSDRIAIVGQNGQGKTTLIKILMKQIDHDQGEIEFGSNLDVGYYAQNQSEFLEEDLTVLELMEQAATEEMRSKVRSILGAFMFSGEDVEKKVKVLSGGERARLSFANMLLKPVNFLVLDEPTNHLDMDAKDVLKQALMQYEGTLLVVSHDRDFLSGLTSKTFELRDHKLFRYLGDVNYFLQKRELENLRQVALHKSENANDIKEKAGGRASQSDRRGLQKKVQRAERKVIQAEEKVKHLERQMAQPDFYESPESAKVLKAYEASKRTLQDAETEWEKVSDQWEQLTDD